MQGSRGTVAGKLRVGIVGFGAVAHFHAEAYRSIPTIEVVGVADPDPKRLREASDRFGLPHFQSFDELLAESAPDLVCVLTPPALHEELALQCARAGVHVLCEKPLALSVEACERMIEGCRANGVRLAYGASYRYLPALALSHTMVR
ncbi:MAG: Gfo/Idh/MocA family protein, partial [Terriglobales bacterium]